MVEGEGKLSQLKTLDLYYSKSDIQVIPPAHLTPEFKSTRHPRYRNLIVIVPLKLIIEHFRITLRLIVEPRLLIPNQHLLQPIRCRRFRQ